MPEYSRPHKMTWFWIQVILIEINDFIKLLVKKDFAAALMGNLLFMTRAGLLFVFHFLPRVNLQDGFLVLDDFSFI